MKKSSYKIMRGIRTIWFDLETTGLNPFHNRIIEIAAIDNDDNAYQSLIKIGQPLEPKITEITKITDEMLNSKGVDEKTVIEEFHTYLQTSRVNTRTFIIAHNGDSFDRMFLKTALKKYGLSVPSNVFFIDSLHFARMTMPTRNSFKQEYLAEKFKVNNPSPHRAYGDVIVLREIWKNMVELFGKTGERTDIAHIYNAIYF
jgi:DNA polymerase III alpha subunit (gram-positive type)